jgi:excisionase family DNA binding protein
MRFDRDTTRTIAVKEAAYRLRKSEDTVYQWLRLGRLRGWQLGGPRCAVLVCEESVEEALAGSFGSDGASHSA